MSKMEVMFSVDAENAGQVMAALAPCMGSLHDFSMELNDSKPKRRPKRMNTRGSRVEQICRKALAAGKPIHHSEIEFALHEAGFARTSASPTLSRMRRAGAVTRDDTADTWTLVS